MIPTQLFPLSQVPQVSVPGSARAQKRNAEPCTTLFVELCNPAAVRLHKPRLKPTGKNRAQQLQPNPHAELHSPHLHNRSRFRSAESEEAERILPARPPRLGTYSHASRAHAGVAALFPRHRLHDLRTGELTATAAHTPPSLPEVHSAP